MLLVWLCVLVCMHELGSPFSPKQAYDKLPSVCECVLSVGADANTEVDCLLNSNQRDVALHFSFG